MQLVLARVANAERVVEVSALPAA